MPSLGNAAPNAGIFWRVELNTEISASSGTETLNVNLQAGRVRVDVNPQAGAKASLTTSSPIATASVRWASFYFDAMNVNVRKGTVAFNMKLQVWE